MPELNVPLAVQVLNQITTQPETHDQSAWVCSTTRCIAGWALELSGTRIKLSKDGNIKLRRSKGNWETVYGHQVRKEAGAALGITDETAETIFLHSGDKEAVAHLARLVSQELTYKADV